MVNLISLLVMNYLTFGCFIFFGWKETKIPGTL